jgi:hypothetical protein
VRVSTIERLAELALVLLALLFVLVPLAIARWLVRLSDLDR